MITSWKTTLCGLITALGVGCLQSTDPTLQLIGKILAVLGPILFGVVAKDFDVHGGTRQQ